MRKPQTAQNDDRHRMQDLETGDVAKKHNGKTAQPITVPLVRIGPSRSLAPRRTSAGPKASPSSLKALVAIDQQDAVAHCNGEDRKPSGKGPEPHGAAGHKHRQHAAGECHDKAYKNSDAKRQLWKQACRSR